MEKYSREKEAHHLWEAEREDGKLRIKRTKHADEEEVFSQSEKKMARRGARSKQAMEETAMACLGIWGASLVDDDLFTRPIPRAIASRFNSVRPDDSPRVHTWSELETVLGSDKLGKTRKAVSDGMKTRLVSKQLDVSFLVAAELIDKMDGMDMGVVKAAVDELKRGSKTAARKKYGAVARDIQAAFDRFGGMKLAVDDKAKKYFEDYYGPYGAELVSDIQRRVRADLAHKWLVKNGVDEEAADYWSNYFSENGYGSALVSDVAKKLSPANGDSDKED
jgi:hypothetical protein